jgi:signal transduction histidine kinase
MGVVGAYLDRIDLKLQGSPRLWAVNAKVRAHIALHREIAGMPAAKINSVRQFIQESGVIELIGNRQGRAHNLLLAGLMFEETSHRLGNVINDLLGNSEACLRCPTIDPSLFLHDVFSLSRKAAKLFKMIAYVQSGLPLSTDPSDLADLLKSGIDDFNNIYEKRCIAKLGPAGIPDNIKLQINRNRFELALFNLLLNSVQHGSNKIDVHVTPIGSDRIKIEIFDNGEGFDQSIRKKIATPAFTTKGDDGHGFGTSITKAFIEESGGTIDWNSPGPGKGCVVTITLPAESDPSHTPPRL